MRKKVTLEEFLMDDEFWKTWKSSEEIPTGFFEMDNEKYEYHPFNHLVGHEDEKRKIERVIEKYVEQLFLLEKLREDLEKKGKKKNFPPGECINDRLRRVAKTMGIVSTGVYGSSKSLQMKIAKELLQMKLEEVGMRGWVYLAEKDKFFPHGFRIDRIPYPGGINYYEKRIKRAILLEKIKSYFLKGIIGFSSAMLLYQTLVFVGIYQNYIADIIFNIGLNLWYDLPRYMQMAQVLILWGIYSALHFFKKRVDSSLPRLLAVTRYGTDPLVGREPREKLIGNYDPGLENLPPQNRWRGNTPEILKVHGNMLAIENLHELSEDLQEFLGQFIEEKIVSIGSLGEEYNEFIYPLIFATINPEGSERVREILQAKLKYFVSFDVKPEVENTEFNRRHLITLLRYRYPNLKFTRGALEEMIEYCNLLAENRKKLYISRRVIALPEFSDIIRKKEGNRESITRSDIKKAVREMLSFIQIPMKSRTESYYQTYEIKLEEEEVGKCYVLCKLLDPALKEEVSEVYLQSDDYISYLVPIEVRAKNGRGRIKFISKGLRKKEKEFYREALKMLFIQENIDLDNYDVCISVPCMRDDEALLAGMYIALHSALNNYKLRLDKVLVVNLRENGKFGKMDRVNVRIFYSLPYLKGKEVIVWSKDFKNSLAREWFEKEDVKVKKVKNLKGIIKMLKYE